MKKRVLTVLLCGLLLCGVVPTMGFAAGASINPGADTEKFTFYGRTPLNSAGELQLFWTNSGFAVKVSGAKTVTATISATPFGESDAAYLNVYVDGAFEPTSTIFLNRAQGTYTLAEKLTAGEHTIEVRKRNEASYGGTATAKISQVSTDGKFLTPPAKAARQIEFIGDSITSGFGNLVTDGSGRYDSSKVDGTMTYAVLAAKQLGAEAQVLSRSGIGYCRNTVIHGVSDSSFYPYYSKTAALPGVAPGNMPWDFENNPSDVVVINLGTNDNGGTRNGAAITNAEMTEEAIAFLELVREKNPDAVIIWHYGMLGDNRAAALEDAVAQLNDEGDEKIYFLRQEGFNSAVEGVGIDGHPTVQANINRSDELARFIAEKTGWKWNAAPMLKAQLQWSAQYNTSKALSSLTSASKKEFTNAIADAKRLLRAANTKNEDLVEASEQIWRTWANRRFMKDISANYIVVDTCDNENGAQLGGNGNKGLDYNDAKEGTAALYTSGANTTLCINHVKTYNVSLPANADTWFLECWLYVDNPANMPAQSLLEILQEVDQIKTWNLRTLGLQAGWNKLQLPLAGLPSGFSTLRTVRLSFTNPAKPITVKLDYVVLAAGREAAKTDSLTAAIKKAEAFLAKHNSKTLSTALAEAKTAVSQADVDVQAVKLTAALAAEEAARGKLGDVNGNGAIDAEDSRLVLKRAVGVIGDAALDVTVADVNGDGNLDTTDARLILQKEKGKIQKFPAEG